MRAPTILDLVQAVVEVAPSHPEVAVWWYARAGVAGVPRAVVLETQDGGVPDTGTISSELAKRLGPSAVAVRLHRGADEGQALYRLLTTEDGRVAAEHAEGS